MLILTINHPRVLSGPGRWKAAEKRPSLPTWRRLLLSRGGQRQAVSMWNTQFILVLLLINSLLYLLLLIYFCIIHGCRLQPVLFANKGFHCVRSQPAWWRAMSWLRVSRPPLVTATAERHGSTLRTHFQSLWLPSHSVGRAAMFSSSEC